MFITVLFLIIGCQCAALQSKQDTNRHRGTDDDVHWRQIVSRDWPGSDNQGELAT